MTSGLKLTWVTSGLILKGKVIGQGHQVEKKHVWHQKKIISQKSIVPSVMQFGRGIALNDLSLGLTAQGHRSKGQGHQVKKRGF